MISSIAGQAVGVYQSPSSFGVGVSALEERGDAAGPVGVESGESDVDGAGESSDLSTQGSDNESAEAGADGLTDEERVAVAELERIDREVRAHEQAHLAAAAGLARGVSFTYVTGPDDQQYAVGGEVSIDTSPAGDPEATIRKAQQIRAAANAPANPSGQDRAVAAQATAMEQAARQELAAEQRAELEAQRRAQVEAQNGEAAAGAFGEGAGASQIGQFLSLIA